MPLKKGRMVIRQLASGRVMGRGTKIDKTKHLILLTKRARP